MWAYLDPSFMAPVVAGLAAVVSVLAFSSFFVLDPKAATLKKRMAAVKDRRSALRDMHIPTSRKKAQNERQTRMMRQALERFKMEEMISNSELKMKLASAGYPGRAAVIRFLFFRLVAPPILALFAFFYLYFILRPENFDALRYVLATIGVGAAGYFLPGLLVENARQKRQKDIMSAYPDALDLMTICVEAGMSIEQSFNKVANEVSAQSVPLAEELALTTAELSYLGDRRAAFENFASRTQLPAVKAITSALIQAERYGTPVGQALRVISQESRTERMSVAEQKAAALPAKLTVPMMVFFLPVLFVVILGPAIINIMGAE